MSEVREELKYTEDHEWILIEDGIAPYDIAIIQGSIINILLANREL